MEEAPRKTRSVRTRTSLGRRPCKFAVAAVIGRAIGHNRDAWFLTVAKSCSGMHNDHYPPETRRMQLPSRLKNEEEVQVGMDIMAAFGGSGVARSLYYYRTGDILDRRTLDALRRCKENSRITDSPGAAATAADQLLRDLRADEDVDFVVMYDDNCARGGAGVQCAARIGGEESTSVHSVGVEAAREIQSTREGARVPPASKMLLVVAWVRKKERAMYRKFPEVSFHDFTAQTCCEKRPLFMKAIKDSNSNIITVLRAYTPNEQSWVCDAVLRVFEPVLLGRKFVERQQLGMFDDMSNEHVAFENARSAGNHNACLCSCGFHKIFLGVHKLGLGCFADRDMGRAVVGRFKEWCKAFMKIYETQGEVDLARRDINAWLDSDKVRGIIGGTASASLKRWLANSFFFKQRSLFFIHRLGIRCFDEYVNSAVETQNSGLKTTNTGTKPNMNWDTSVRAQNFRGGLRERFAEDREAKLLNSVPTYTNTDSGSRVTAYAEENAHRQCVWQEGLYYTLKKSRREYLVMRRRRAHTESPITRFARVRHVRVCINNRVSCSCMFWERHGFPCRHIYELLQKVSATDFDVRWHLRYLRCYAENGEEEYTRSVDALRARPARGPFWAGELAGSTDEIVKGLQSEDDENRVRDVIFSVARAAAPIVIGNDGAIVFTSEQQIEQCEWAADVEIDVDEADRDGRGALAGQTCDNSGSKYYLEYKAFASQLADITKGNPKAHAEVMEGLRQARSAAYKHLKEVGGPCGEFASSNPKLRSSATERRGGREHF